jgi:hypothetical protein
MCFENGGRKYLQSVIWRMVGKYERTVYNHKTCVYCCGGYEPCCILGVTFCSLIEIYQCSMKTEILYQAA